MKAKVIAVLAGACLLSGCGSGGGLEENIPTRSVTPIDSATAGSISGVVFYTGAPPVAQELKIAGNPECSSLQHGPLYSEALLVQDGRLINAFVYIKAGLEDTVFGVPEEAVRIDNRRCIYVPHVAGAQVQQAVQLVNSDPTLHNMNIMAKYNNSLNFGFPVQGMKRTHRFSKAEVMLSLKCDVHPWMRAYLGVLDHPFFKVTGPDGSYNFEGVPPGNYSVAVWHETLGEIKTELQLNQAGALVHNFELGG